MRHLLRLSLILFVTILVPFSLSARECIDWPRAMTLWQVNNLTEGKFAVVESFTDYTKKAGDDWLTYGLRDLFASMLASGGSLRVLYGPAAVYHPRAKDPDFIVSGMFQNLDGGIRVFVKVLQGSDKKLLNQFMLVAPYPGSAELFIRAADIVKQIFPILGTGVDDNRLVSVRDATSSMQAYECYAKGRQALETYKLSEIEVAKIWFEQSKRNDYRSYLGYQGMADLFAFLGYYHKQRNEPYNMYFEEAEKELTTMQRLTKRPPPVYIMQKKPGKKEDQSAKVENRYLLGNSAYTEAKLFANSGNTEMTIQALVKAVIYVPEDAVAWYQLSHEYAKIGNSAEATNALQKAYTVNPCIEK